MRRLPVALAALTLLSALVLVPTSAAYAEGEVEVSPDGTAWGHTLSAPLFEGIALVPRGSASSTFMLRNSSEIGAFVRVVLQDVTFSSTTIGDALQIAVTLGGVLGVPAALTSASPCRVLFEGQLAAGATAPVIATLALGDLSGTQGQGESAQFSIGIQLSDSTLGAIPTDCGAPTAVLKAADFDSRVATTVGLGVDPNTWQNYEEYLLLILVAALALGVGAQRPVAAWLRLRDAREQQERQYQEDLA